MSDTAITSSNAIESSIIEKLRPSKQWQDLYESNYEYIFEIIKMVSAYLQTFDIDQDIIYKTISQLITKESATKTMQLANLMTAEPAKLIWILQDGYSVNSKDAHDFAQQIRQIYNFQFEQFSKHLSLDFVESLELPLNMEIDNVKELIIRFHLLILQGTDQYRDFENVENLIKEYISPKLAEKFNELYLHSR